MSATPPSNPDSGAVPTAVFISYSHDSSEHTKEVLSLSERLREDGFRTEIDQYVEGTPEQGWPRWMLDQLDAADFVLVVCTETYYRRFRGHEEPGRGKGADWEGALITQELYDERSRTLKFIPVLLDGAAVDWIPEPLRGHTFYALTSESRYIALRDFLTGVAGVEPGPIGPPPEGTRRRGMPSRFGSSEALSKPIRLPDPSLRELFSGRDDVLTMLRESLEGDSGHTTAIVAKAVHGLGGVGKTRLAVEYAWRNLEHYSAVLFVGAETPQVLNQNLAALTSPEVLNLPEHGTTEETVQRAATLRWLTQHPGWLLILDNLDTPAAAAAAEDLLASLRGGHVILTSRIGQWSGSVRTLQLDVLDVASAKRFLLDRTEGRRQTLASDDSDARALAVDLDGLAIALEQAGAYVSYQRISIAEYRERWRSKVSGVVEWHDERVMKYPHSLAVTWQTTIDQLSDGEIALLRLLAWLAPEAVPHFLFESDEAEELWREATASLSDTVDVGGSLSTALSSLANFSVINWDPVGRVISVHRVVQEVLRTRLDESAQRTWLHLSLQLLDRILPRPAWDVRSWSVWDPLRPHVAAAVERGDRKGIPDPTVRLMAELGQLVHAKALFAEAEPLMRRTLAILEGSYGADHPRVAIGLINLAQLLQATNRLDEAEPLMRRALAIDEASYGVDHPEVAIDLNNLAQLLKATNRLDEAEALMRRALGINEASHEPDHPTLAIRLNNLASLLQATNRLDEAEPLMRRALAIDEASFGADHPRVAIGLNNLAQVLHDTNRLDDAEPLMRRALAIDEASYGPEHPTVATRLSNLAALLQATNRMDEAEPLMRRALAIDEASYGPDHPTVATDLNNLAQLLKATNRLDEAEPLIERALVIDEASYGSHHPRVAIRLSNLASVLQATNRMDEAEPLMRRALVIDEGSYGSDHPTVAIRLNNLASLLKATDRLSEAEPLMRRALTIDEGSYGPDHPTVAIRLNNLAQVLQATDRLDDAELLMRRALTIDEGSYGVDHPRVATRLSNLASLLRATNRMDEAEPLMRRALAIDEGSYGPDHPTVAIRLNNLAMLLWDTNRLEEAEPLARRNLLIFVDFARRAGHEHPHFQAAWQNYAGVLLDLGRTEAEVLSAIEELTGGA